MNPTSLFARTLRFGTFLIWITSGLLVKAQPDGNSPDRKPPPPEMGDEDRGFRVGVRNRRDGRGSPWGDDFHNLSDDDKNRVREALAKVWVRPEVVSARERMMKANEEMRETLRLAVIEVDPTVASLLEKMRPPGGGGLEGPGGPGRDRAPPPLPELESPEFPRAIVKRLITEMIANLPPDRRERIQAMHDEVMQQPEVRAAIEQLESAVPGERLAAVENLRKRYRETFAGFIKDAAARRPGSELERGQGGGFRRPPTQDEKRPSSDSGSSVPPCADSPSSSSD